MATAGVNVRTSVHVTARSFTYLANEINRVFMEAITGLGLDPYDYASNQETIEIGLRTWITMHQLEAAHLEVYDPASGILKCRMDLRIQYRDARGEETYKTDIERVRGSIWQQYPGCHYRIVVTTAPGATQVRGWSNTDFRDYDHLKRTDLGDVIETSAAAARMSTWF